MDVDLDLVELRTLVEVRATGSMTAAAAALGCTTGAVQQQMAALQRSVRAGLFTQVGDSWRSGSPTGPSGTSGQVPT
ncbi:helix-turn-helix domain-containing protein [Geodermatophilus sp. URMC 61]|uniref:helix-turn-helix domain-containing protein n=1 Tax=Geodermatophilus sp. URMC 61 TaxID=3423411 RepID=UPI00406C4920